MSAPDALLGARRLRELFATHGVRPDKMLGQNFVVDPNTIRKVVSMAALTPTDRVLEIGAGAGSLTLGLAGVAERVIAVEFDRRLAPVLADALGGVRNVDVLIADATAIDLAHIAANRVVANLPYNIAATMVLKVLEEAAQIDALTVMTQKEVGQRLAAGPGSKSYGQVSVLVRYFGEARIAGSVSRRAFYPVPGVDSVVVHIERRPMPEGPGREILYPVVRAAFSQRRKTLRNALATLMGSPSRAERVLRSAGVDPAARAEQLSLEDYLSIAKASPR